MNTLPADDTDPKTHTKERISEDKRQCSVKALQSLPPFDAVIATDGGVNVSEGKSVGIATTIPEPYTPTRASVVHINCGPIACSYRAECLGLLLALEKLVSEIINNESRMFPAHHKSILIVTDSLLLVLALNTGPLTQTSFIEDTLWYHLLEIENQGW
ncbi:unnamed protein product [Phytomonas sp. EM1]|nr:unnamed protein product [Phytomonas sp. EM1]|eukprot:CCW65858.1 unnamed protein product [Phytomonas sp. isolate EM1]